MTNLIDARPSGPAVPLPPPRTVGRPPTRTPAGARVLWKLLAGAFVVGATMWGPYQIVTLLAHEERVETETFPAAGIDRLEVDSAAGSIRIHASERDTIDVRAEISDGLRRTGESREVVGSTLRLHSTCPNIGSDFCRVHYDVLVPRDLEIVVDGDHGGVTVTGSAAPLTIDGDNGSIELVAVSGPARLSTNNGRIEATQLRSSTVTASADNGRIALEFATAPTTVVATADNGRVEVVVPDDGAAYRLDITTENGRRTEDVPVDSSSERTITIRTANGSATARTAAG